MRITKRMIRVLACLWMMATTSLAQAHLDGTSRIPLRDNNDGTMTDNNGHLYKRDGNHVRRVL